MSKVIHVSTKTHNLAKQHCRLNGKPMSDWVASLIEAATGKSPDPDNLLDPVEAEEPEGETTIKVSHAKKKSLDQVPAPQVTADSLPAYASPPFWAMKTSPGT